MTDDTVNRPRPDPNQGSLELTEEYIRLRAYYLYEQHGHADGHDVEDWLEAEAEVLGKEQPTQVSQEPETEKAMAAAAAA